MKIVAKRYDAIYFVVLKRGEELCLVLHIQYQINSQWIATRKRQRCDLIRNGKHNEMRMTISLALNAHAERTFYKFRTVKVQIYEHEKNNKVNDTTRIAIK